ncbi:unnamed protein product [Fusarium graminearum]|nr:unnamed protein product [Fusarium graminearum]
MADYLFMVGSQGARIMPRCVWVEDELKMGGWGAYRCLASHDNGYERDGGGEEESGQGEERRGRGEGGGEGGGGEAVQRSAAVEL